MKMLPLPTAVTFDAAGTLFDLAEPVGVTYARLARPFGVTAEPDRIEDAFRSTFDQLPPPHSPGFATSGQTGEESERTWWRTLVRGVFEQSCEEELSGSIFAPLFDTLFDHYAEASAWRAAPGIAEVLETLARHTRLGVISNFDHRFHSIASGLDLLRFFEVVILSSDVGASKPDSVIFAAAAERLGLPPGEIQHVGDDAVRDGEGARRAGFQAFPLISRTHPVTEILKALGLSEV